MWDIQVLGLENLERKWRNMDAKVQRKILATAARNSAKRTKDRMVENLSGHPVGVVTGRTREAFKKARIRSGSRSRNFIRVGPVIPTREELGIPPWPEEKSFYPFALEYGTSRMAARPFIRPAIDNHVREELNAVAAEVAPKIMLMWRAKR
jgi:HK97 gp10 family phage protein